MALLVLDQIQSLGLRGRIPTPAPTTHHLGVPTPPLYPFKLLLLSFQLLSLLQRDVPDPCLLDPGVIYLMFIIYHCDVPVRRPPTCSLVHPRLRVCLGMELSTQCRVNQAISNNLLEGWGLWPLCVCRWVWSAHLPWDQDDEMSLSAFPPSQVRARLPERGALPRVPGQHVF